MSPEDVKALRHRMNLTQESFAPVVGVTVSTINRWERGLGAPSKLALRRLKEIEAVEKAK